MCDNDVRVGFKDLSSCPFYVVDWVEGTYIQVSSDLSPCYIPLYWLADRDPYIHM